jgi:hypothetical protein
MTKLFAAAALIASIAAPAFAKDAPQQKTFTRDGETFTYVATEKKDATILTGRSASGRDFRLVVRNGYVHGFSGNVPVFFSVPKATTRPSVELAAR